jgi:hypothetical protein
MPMPKDEQKKEMTEARWSSDEDSKRIKALKKGPHDLYVNCRGVYESAS